MSEDNIVNLSERRLIRDGYEGIDGTHGLALLHCHGCDEWKAGVFTWVLGVGLLCPECVEDDSA